MEFINQLLSSDFMPHGFCYLWNPRILWLHVVSDGLIALSYYCIPLILVYFIRKNRDLPFNRIFWMFGTFILACGTTHLMEIWNVWHGDYLLAGFIKAVTAAVSVLTAAMLIPLIPKVISLPERAHLQEINRDLERQIAERKRLDAPLDTPLRRKVTGGFFVAILLTAFLGYSGWRSARRAEEDDYRVSHTHEVMETIQRTTRHVIVAETSARAFALTGQEPLLANYRSTRQKIIQDEAELRSLTADNLSQQQRIDVLDPQVRAALDFADSIIAKRRESHAYPGGSDALEIERHLDVVTTTTGDVYAEETRLLGERTQRARAGQLLTKLIAIIGALLGVGLWVSARFAVNREIDFSARTQTQLNTLNCELEQRVQRRTAALQSEILDRRAAQETAERLAAVVESSGDAIIGKTLDGTITAWNHGAQKIFGYSPLEAIGGSMRMLIPPERANEETEILARIARGESVEHFETTRVRKDGTHIDVSVAISPIKDASGTIVGASKIARDITERKRVEEALHEQSKVLDLAQVLVRDMSSRIVLWNRGAEKLYGFTKEEAVGRFSHELLRTDFPEPIELIEESLRRDGTWEGELIHHTRDGARIVVSSLWLLHRDAKGKATRILEANVDITARKKAEQRLAEQAAELAQQSEELIRSKEALETQSLTLRSVLDSMAEGLVAADEQGNFIIWNAAAEKIVGLGPGNMPTQDWTEHYGLFLTDAVTPFPPEQNPLARAIRGEAGKAEMFLRNSALPEGAWIEASANPLRDKDGLLRGGVVAFRDITQRKTDERKIQKLNDELEIRVADRTAQLETANKELESFSYSVSHDLRAPLRHISGFAKMLAEEFGSSLAPGAHHYLNRIQAGTQKMGLLVDELLNLARVGRHSVNRQPTDLNPIITDLIAILEPDREGRTVQWEIATLPQMECDPVLVKQIFQNLLANALKFTRARPHTVIEISHQAKDAAGQPVFTVRDNGIGFNMKYVDKLFGVFQRLHREEEFEGTGIGLATVQRIVQKHGGRVWAEGEIDKGAAFHFTLSVEKQTEKYTESQSKSDGAAAAVAAGIATKQQLEPNDETVGTRHTAGGR
jgi:PAS domain S-box-containing protein